MMILRLLRWIAGYVRITVSGHFTERFLNLLNCSGLRVWDVKKISGGRLSVCIKAKKFKRLKSIRAKTKVSIEIAEKCGLPFIRHRYRRRIGLAVGAVLFIGILAAMSCFVWSIEIVGDVSVRDEVILAALDECGLRVGMPLSSVDADAIKQRVLIKLDELSFCAVNLFGSKAIVEVAQATPPPETEDTYTPCNLVAAVDGVIVETQVTQGFPVVKAGDAVSAGNILVSGVIDSEKVGYRLVHSTGKVYARTRRTLTCEIPLSQTQTQRTGEHYSNFRLRLFNFYINLYFGTGTRYDKYDKIEKKYEVRIGSFVFPVEIVKQTYYEKVHIQCNITQQQAENAAQLQLQDMEAEQLFGKVVESRTVTVIFENDVCRITGEYGCIEDIAEKRTIETQ